MGTAHRDESCLTCLGNLQSALLPKGGWFARSKYFFSAPRWAATPS